jgi:hypothetical protein
MNIRKKFSLVVASSSLAFCMLYLNVVKDSSFFLKSKVICGRFPTAKDILVDNEIWQVLKAPTNSSLFLLNAYYDARQNKSVVINVVGFASLNLTVENMFCQFWFKKKDQPIVVPALKMKAGLGAGELKVK